MRAIIIDDKDARDLIQQLELAKLQETRHFRGDKPITLDDMHRTFHYIVTQWLQDQGANTGRY